MEIRMDSILNEDISTRMHRVEQYSKVTFPKSYTEFIEKYNIGIPITNEFVYNNRSYAISRFLGFVNGYRSSSLGNYDIAVVLSQIDTRLTDNPSLEGDELIPIAELFAGDYVCLDFRVNKQDPCVCVWSHEESEEFLPVTHRVADTFCEFINILQ